MSTTNVSQGRVLIVDDEPAVLDSYARSLSEAGFEVARAEGGAEALRRIETDQFDLVLTDISMPKIDGLGLLRQMRAAYPELSVVLMLDKLDNATTVEAAELGALQSLVKPIERNLLERTAAHAVQLKRMRPVSSPVLRDRRSELRDPSKVTATQAKNEFGRILDRVIQGGVVFITKHQEAKAVLISVDEFNCLSRANEVKLETLSGEFDALLARMQTSEARAGMKAAFDASPNQLGKAAVAVARKRS